jgi:hypothetical protein
VASPNHSRWIDRIVGAAIGAMATAWWLWPRAVDDGDVIAQSDVAPTEEVIDVAPEVPPPVETPAADEVPAAPVVDDVPREIEASPVAAPTEPATTTAPALPLPRMPGDTRLSNSSRFDETTRSWIVKAAYRVVAREHHVVAFYKKALVDQGLTVTQSQAQPAADGSVKTYLHGKSGRVHAQVGIAPRTDVLETRVWILWRTRA